VPVEQDCVRHFLAAFVEGFLAVFGFIDDKVDVLEDAAGDLPDDA
jgi:hypothetical protein